MTVDGSRKSTIIATLPDEYMGQGDSLFALSTCVLRSLAETQSRIYFESVRGAAMDVSKIPPGRNPPIEINVLIEIPQGGVPVKYELDKISGALFVNRFLHTAIYMT
jgi:hypothetical protein